MALWNQGASIGYSCLRFIEEWAHPLININITLIGLSSGLVQKSVNTSAGTFTIHASSFMARSNSR